VRDFVRGFLPENKYLEIMLEEICSQCPLNDDEKKPRNLSESVMERIDSCRKRYFGFILQSFVGKPGEKETDWLYSYLKRCEDCLFSREGINFSSYAEAKR
jgi:hypothetical protein